jgi:zinc protease
MALVVVENKQLPIASFVLLVPGAGAAADPAGKRGLASFTADLLDEGAGGMTAIAVAEETDRLGASISFHVDTDETLVVANTLGRTLDATIDLMTKIVTQPAFDPKDFDRVRGDRSTDLDLRRDHPTEVASIVLTGRLYGFDSAYGHPTTGVRETFKGLSLADVQRFYKERWNPAVMTLVVAGDVDVAKLQAKLDAGLGAWKPTTVKPFVKVDATPQPIGKRLAIVDRETTQSDVRIGLVGPGRHDKRYYQFEVLRTALGDGFTSRLTQKLREEMGITYNIGASISWNLQPGPFVIATSIQTPDTGRGLAEIIKILDALAANEMPAKELEKTKQSIIRGLPSHFNSNATTALTFAELATHGLPDDYYASYADAVRKVTAKEVRDVAKALLPSGSMTFAIVGDWKKIKAGVDKLQLGAPAMHDAYGMPN